MSIFLVFEEKSFSTFWDNSFDDTDVVDEIINERGGYKLYPASYIKPSFGKLSWYLDFDAAENLTK